MGHGAHIASKKSPVFKECANPGCRNMFWGWKTDKYCSPDCSEYIDRIKNKLRVRKWRKKNKDG